MGTYFLTPTKVHFFSFASELQNNNNDNAYLRIYLAKWNNEHN